MEFPGNSSAFTVYHFSPHHVHPGAHVNDKAASFSPALSRKSPILTHTESSSDAPASHTQRGDNVSYYWEMLPCCSRKWFPTPLDTAAAMALPSSPLESLFHRWEAPSIETVILSPPENKTSYQLHGNVSQDESSLRATAQTTVTIQTGAFR